MISLVLRWMNDVPLSAATKSETWGMLGEYEIKKPPGTRAFSACFSASQGSGKSNVMMSTFFSSMPSYILLFLIVMFFALRNFLFSSRIFVKSSRISYAVTFLQMFARKNDSAPEPPPESTAIVVLLMPVSATIAPISFCETICGPRFIFW